MISDKVFYGKKGLKYFIGNKDDEKVKPLCIMLPKMSGYIKVLMKLNICPFRLKMKNRWKHAIKCAIKLAIYSKKDLIANQCIMKKKIKNKIKSYYDKINTKFHDERMPKEGYHIVLVCQ